MKRLATHAHAYIYRLTRGRVGARVGGQDVLLLDTTVPLAYNLFGNQEDDVVKVALEP